MDKPKIEQTPAVNIASQGGLTSRGARFASTVPVLYLRISGVSLCLVLSLGAWWLGLGPVIHERAKAINQQQALDEGRDQLRSLKTQTIQVERDLDQLRRELAASPMRLAPVSSINRPLANISELANKIGLTVEQLGDGNAQDWPHFQIVPIGLRGSGRFPALSRFLHRLHQQMPDIGLARMELQARSKTNNSQVQFELTLAWYVAPNS